VAQDLKYDGRDAHVLQVTAYLRRTTRTKYRLDDLKKVCEFLEVIPRERALYAKLLARGIKLFPKAPLFHMLTGDLEMKKAPPGFRSLARGRECYEKALTLAQQSADPADIELVPDIQQGLSMIKDMDSGPMGLPFPGFGGSSAASPAAQAEFARFLDTMARSMGMDPAQLYNELDDDGDGFFRDDDDDEPGRPSFLPGGTPRPKAPKRKKG
jgi:hypothetical protein